MFFCDSDPFRPTIPISFENWTIFPGISGRLISESLDDIFGIDGRFPPDYAYTGHCAYTLSCDRWKIGCGECPHLDVYPPVLRDNTRYNWQRKKSIFSDCQLALVTPSRWLEQQTQASILSDLSIRVIPNGVDLDVYMPGSRSEARKTLGLNLDDFVILCTAAGGRGSPFKDFEMLDRVITHLIRKKLNKSLILVALGGQQDRKEMDGLVQMIEKPFIKDMRKVACYYQACDLYIHTAKAENAPLVIMEAMACGKPIVATDAGGIPEIVREGENGYTVPIGDDGAMVARILELINDQNRLRKMGVKASEIARREYGMKRMVNDYLNLYQELINEYIEQSAG